MLSCDTRFGNLFTVEKPYYLVQCISADLAMGAGIALQFNTRFDMRNKLLYKYPDGYDRLGCIFESGVFNLVTKIRYYEKPDYCNIEYCLQEMFKIMKENNIHKIAMPRIGCGLDGLQFGLVYQIIKNVFSDIDYAVDLIIYIN